MPSEEWAEVEQLYHAAMKLAPSARETFLENACAGNTALRKQIESLHAYDEQAAPFRESPLLGGADKWARRAPVELRASCLQTQTFSASTPPLRHALEGKSDDSHASKRI
jgi:hypothetical protein